jgi:integrase
VASLQQRHSRKCAGHPGKWTAMDAEGCTCNPSFYIVADGGKTQELLPTKNKKEARAALNKVNVTVHETGEWEPPKKITFSEWADEWTAGLKRPSGSTRYSYRPTIAYAKQTFGHTQVRQIGPAHVQQFLDEIKTLSPSSQSKHLRVLSAVMDSAVRRGYATRNPVKLLEPAARPQSSAKEAAYFQDDELPKLIANLPTGLARTLVLVSLKTGMRAGELLELRWDDCDLGAGLIRVRRGWSAVDHVTETKSKTSRRDVELTTDVVKLLGKWWGESGKPEGAALVFPGETASGRLGVDVARRILYPAMTAAGVPRTGPTGEERTFHSLRHTYARVCLENGLQLSWLSKQLGHSSTNVTDTVYGHWSRKAAKAENAKLEGVFKV